MSTKEYEFAIVPMTTTQKNDVTIIGEAAAATRVHFGTMPIQWAAAGF